MQINEIIDRINLLERQPLVIEAFWEKNKGWGIVLAAIVAKGSALHPQYTQIPLHFFQGYGGDMRIIIRDVPPWPEVEEVREIGEAIEKQLNIPYIHNVSELPTENIIRWWDA